MTQQQTADGAAARHKYVFEIQRAAENFTLTRMPVYHMVGWGWGTLWKLQGKLIVVRHSCNYSTE